MMTLPVPHFYVDNVWSKVSEILKPAVDLFDGYLLEDVKAMIKHRTWQLWLGIDDDNEVHVVAVTVINNYPRKKTCLVLYTAGKEMDNWTHLMRDIEVWAGQNGCQDLEFRGRRGWLRVMTEFKQTGIIASKQIGGSHA